MKQRKNDRELRLEYLHRWLGGLRLAHGHRDGQLHLIILLLLLLLGSGRSSTRLAARLVVRCLASQNRSRLNRGR